MVDGAQRLEDEFLLKLVDFAYGQVDASEIEKLSLEVSWAKGWPKDPVAFWNVETFLWQRRIPKKKRDFIETELLKIKESKDSTLGKSLDIGCGSYSYIVSDVGLDVSSRMLKFNDRILEKVQGDLEEKWNFSSGEFSYVSCVFGLNYLNKVDFVLSAALRVLSQGGKFVVVLSAKGVSALHQQHEKQKFGLDSWKLLLEKHFGTVDSYEKEDLWFFFGIK